MPILQWLTRGEDIRAASRILYHLLEEGHDLSAGDLDTDNMLIQGDNLKALKALLPFYSSRVKCIYIDPPYNTGAAFDQYDDNLEHSQWLGMMWPRLELLRDLLADDGSIWVQLDDNEPHHARVILDEILGRKNFVADVTWHKSYAVRSNAEFVSSSTEHLLWYCKDRRRYGPNKLPRTEEQRERFSNPDNDRRGPWQSITFTISLMSGARGRQFARTGESTNIYTVASPTGATFDPPPGRCWARIESGFKALDADGRIWWGHDQDRVPRLKMFLSEANQGVIPTSLWAGGQEFGYNQDGIRELRSLDLSFPTPKPERLIERILRISTNLGDLVLDSFLGSGTTAAVAHKMGRRYIGIEMGEQAVTHCVPRLNKVIGGEQGGISRAVGWQGGGGFRFYRLGEPVFDESGRINREIRFPLLAAHIWFCETQIPWMGEGKSPLLGVHDDHAYALLYNGILGDKRPSNGNILTRGTLRVIREAILREYPGFDGPLTVYGEGSRLAPQTLERECIVFRHIPYEVMTRG